MRPALATLLAACSLALAACGGPTGSDTAAPRAERSAQAAAPAPAIPSFDPATGTLSVPDVNYSGSRWGQALLQHVGNYRFVLAQEPALLGPAAMSASSYADGRLRMASVRVGNHRYANVVLELGAGGVFTLVAASDPLPVAATSYQNKNDIPFDATQVPTVRALGIPPVAQGEQDSNERSIAFADFFQEGRYSAFVMANRGTNLHGVPFLNDVPGVAYFLARGDDGQWVDRTSELLPDPAQRGVCVSSSYSSVADFNNDGKPDVFVSCTGVDYDLGITDPEVQQQVYLSEQVLLASQPDGTYRRVAVPHRIYGHKAAAADIDGDGNIDILTTNQALGGVRMPFVLLGQGDGTFVRNDSIVPANLFEFTGEFDGLYQVWLVPIGGRLDVVFASSGRTVWMKGNGSGGFDTAQRVTFEAAASAAHGKAYEMPLDLVYDAVRQRFYFHSTAGHSNGTEWVVLAYDATGKLAGISELWDNLTDTLQPYSAQFKPTADGYLVAYTGGCGAALDSQCQMHVLR